MLEKIGQSAYTTISRPDWDVIRELNGIISSTSEAITVAEIGIGIGATTAEVAKRLKNRGFIHIFDFEESVSELRRDLADAGFSNVVSHGNTGKYWDSYHWSLAKLIDKEPPESTFNLIYIDGAHTYLHDALAFFMCDRLLKVGGVILFDDYDWSFSQSKYLSTKRDDYMTEEQANTKQIKWFIDQLVKTNPNYEEFLPNKGFRKIAASVKK